MRRFFSLILSLAILLLAVPFSFSAAAEETAYPRTVYLEDGGTGDGASASSPAGSLTELVDAAAEATHVILTGDYTTAANSTSSNMFVRSAVPVKITAQNGARLILSSHIVMQNGALELDDLTIEATGNYWFKMQSHALRVGKNVTCTLGGDNTTYPAIVGTTEGSVTGKSTSIFVESGEWSVLRGGSTYDKAKSTSGSVFNITVTGGVFHSYVAFGSRGQVTGGQINVDISGGTFYAGLYCIYGENDSTGYKADYRMTMRVTGGTVYGAILPAEKRSCTLTGSYELALLGGDFSHLTDVRGAEENAGTMQSTLLVAEGLLDGVPDKETTFTNTFGVGADPFLFYYDHCYYLTRTTSKNLAIRKASCIADLKTAPERIVYTIQDGSDLWSPEIHYISEAEAGENAGWYCYFGYASNSTSGDSVASRQRAYVIKCLDGDELVYGRWGDPVTGEVNVARKLTNDSDDAFNNGGLYGGFSKLRIGNTLYFSYVTEFGRGTSSFHQEIMISAVTNPWTFTGTPVSICRSEYDWEQDGYGYFGGKWYPKVVEGASVVYYDDENGDEQFYLMYTGSGYWTKGYALGYLRCTDPAHPLVASNWEKATATSVLRYDYNKNDINGSGHGSYIRTENGHWLAYHGYLQRNAGGSRHIFIEPMTVNSSGVSIGDGDGHPANLTKVYTVPVTELSLRETLRAFTTVTEVSDPDGSERVVFVDGINGKDTGLGLSASAPYKTVAAAAARLALFGGDGRIVVSGRTVLPAGTELPEFGGVLTFTSLFSGSDYRESGACLLPAGAVTLGGDLTLDALDLVLPSSVSYFYARFHDLTVTGCRAYSNAGTASAPQKGALNTADYRLGVIAGGADAGTAVSGAVAQTVRLESLNWHRAAGGSKAVGGSTYTSADLTPAVSGTTVISVGGDASVRSLDTVSSVRTVAVLPVSLRESVTVKAANAPDPAAETTVYMTAADQQSGLTDRLSFVGGLEKYLEKGFSMRAKATGRGYGMRAGFIGTAALLADAEEIGILVKHADNPNPLVWFAGTAATDANRIGKSRSLTAGADVRYDSETVPGSYLFNAPLIFDNEGAYGYVAQADSLYVFLPYAVYSLTTADGYTGQVCLYGEEQNSFTFREVATYLSENKTGAQKEMADAALADLRSPIDSLVPSDGEKLRIAFIGDSITQGTGTPLEDQPTQSYPGQLQALLGENYVIGNFGKASAYTLPADDPYNAKASTPELSYRNTQRYAESLTFGADVVVIALGCNDIRSFSSAEAMQHYKDALASLANEYAALPTVQKVYIATHIPTTNVAVIRQFSEGVLQNLQREVAAENGYEVIDIYEMTRDYFNVMMHWGADRVHPNYEQYGEMARAYYAFFKGQSFTPTVPETSASGVVYVKTGGQSAGQGATPATALDSLAKAVGLLRETGGTVVLCGPYTTTYETHLPNTAARITVTSSYGGTDYAASAGAYLGIAHNLYLYGDYTFENITVRADVANSIIIGNYHNNVFGEGITCTLKSGITTYPLLLVGYNVALGGVPVEGITLHGTCDVRVDSGTWAYLRCGNRRPNAAYPVGGVDPDAVLRVTVNGGTYRNSSGNNMTAATGMNSSAGTSRLTINGGEFLGSVFAVSRIGTNSTGVPAVMSGNVYLTVNGGTIGGAIGAVQDSTISVTGGVYLTVAEEFSSKVTQAGFTEITVLEEPPVVLPPSNNLLFSPTKSGIYNYCPTVIEETDGTRYVYYCTNQSSYNVTDYIGCRRGTPNADGTYTYGAETIVLSPSLGAWDSRHVCDPSVIRGSFSYQGTTYSYLMAYLGCSSSDNQENKVGLAVANSPTGPFVRVGNAPIVDFTMDPDVTSFQWGVGQPCLISQNEAGKVWLFYTKGDKNGTRTIVRTCEFADLDNPTLGTEMRVSVTGLENLNGGTDILNNADFAYAGGTVFYGASDCHPNPTDAPDFISSAFRVTRLERFTSGGVAFTDSNASWTNLAVVGSEETGFARNHNVCLVRDEYGRLPDRDYLTVYYSKSDTGSGNSSLWTYRIYDRNVALR